jgi:hypothetical protein
MRSTAKTVLIGGLLSLPLLLFGAGFIAMGVDATIHRWASMGATRHSFRPSTKTNDITRLYGPGAVLAGVSLVVGGLLVIPSGLIRDHGIGRRFWPKIVLLWRLVGVGIAAGVGMAILASIVNVLWRG